MIASRNAEVAAVAVKAVEDKPIYGGDMFVNDEAHFQNRLGQLFHEQGNTIRLGDNFIHQLCRQYLTKSQ